MKTPVHHLKTIVNSISGKTPATSYVTEHQGWLGSGVLDKNGVEIYEGDRVSVSEHEHPFTVMFVDGAFWLDNNRMKCYLTYFHNSKLEVVGHIAEEQQ